MAGLYDNTHKSIRQQAGGRLMVRQSKVVGVSENEEHEVEKHINIMRRIIELAETCLEGLEHAKSKMNEGDFEKIKCR